MRSLVFLFALAALCQVQAQFYPGQKVVVSKPPPIIVYTNTMGQNTADQGQTEENTREPPTYRGVANSEIRNAEQTKTAVANTNRIINEEKKKANAEANKAGNRIYNKFNNDLKVASRQKLHEKHDWYEARRRAARIDNMINQCIAKQKAILQPVTDNPLAQAKEAEDEANRCVDEVERQLIADGVSQADAKAIADRSRQEIVEAWEDAKPKIEKHVENGRIAYERNRNVGYDNIKGIVDDAKQFVADNFANVQFNANSYSIYSDQLEISKNVKNAISVANSKVAAALNNARQNPTSSFKAAIAAVEEGVSTIDSYLKAKGVEQSDRDAIVNSFRDHMVSGLKKAEREVNEVHKSGQTMGWNYKDDHY